LSLFFSHGKIGPNFAIDVYLAVLYDAAGPGVCVVYKASQVSALLLDQALISKDAEARTVAEAWMKAVEERPEMPFCRFVELLREENEKVGDN
jgi:hypothetical protein